MNPVTVVEFLRNVPLLQRLPTSSLKRISEVVAFKRYGKGEYVVHKDQAWDGIYFIWEGEAEVYGGDSQESRLQFLLERFDYFGHSIYGLVHPADIVALSELTCLVLPRDHFELLEIKAMWERVEPQSSTLALVERIIDTKPIELNLFRGVTLPSAVNWGRVFGGQFMGQALTAATKTVDSLKHVHSLHSYFLRIGDIDQPVMYEVQRVRDGKSFATRRVNAVQNGQIVFTMFASFQREQEGFEHQVLTMPTVPDPETLLSMDELRRRHLTDPLLPKSYRKKILTPGNSFPYPVEIRFCDTNRSTNRTITPPRLMIWFRSKGQLSDNQSVHRCVVAYTSDLIFSGVTLNPHRGNPLSRTALSIDHSIWFHQRVKADDWMLYVISSPIAGGARGFVTGQMFNRQGGLVATSAQETAIRPPQPAATASKL